MRCSCCNSVLEEKEIVWNKELDKWELCATCLNVAFNAAFCDGFSPNDKEEIVIYDSIPLLTNEFDSDIISI